MPKKDSVTNSILLDISFYIETDDEEYIYLHNAQKLTQKTYLARIKKWFGNDLNDPKIKDLGLPDNIKLVSWKIELVDFPKLFKFTYTTSEPLNASDRESYGYWITGLDNGGNRPIEYYKKSYTIGIGIHRSRNNKK